MNALKKQLFQTGRILRGRDHRSKYIEKGTGENSFCFYEELSSCYTTCLNRALRVKCLIAAIITGNTIKIQVDYLVTMKQIGDTLMLQALVLSFQDD